jgi:hypothetical protein
MSPPDARSTLPLRLHCLGGGDAPPDVTADLARVKRLPAEARARLWEVLGPCLGEAIPSAAEQALDRFCQAHGLEGDLLARSLKVLRFLVREAALRDLSAAVLAEDVAAASGGDDDSVRLVLAGYEAGKRVVRGEAIRRSLADHGKLVERVDWRVDYLGRSSRGEGLRAPVAQLTMTYREGEARERVTLSFTREGVEELRAACEKILA